MAPDDKRQQANKRKEGNERGGGKQQKHRAYIILLMRGVGCLDQLVRNGGKIGSETQERTSGDVGGADMDMGYGHGYGYTLAAGRKVM